MRQVASLYPERPEIRHISFQTATRLVEVNKVNGNKVVPLETIQKTLNNRKEEIQRLHGELDRVNQHRSRLQRAEGYLNHYENQHTMVEKMENNPFLKGKIRVSKSVSQEYEQAMTKRDHYQDLMKNEGVSGRAAFIAQAKTLGRMEAQIPKVERQIQSQENGMGLLEGIIKGIEQASRNMQMDEQRQNYQRQKPKKRKQQGELEGS